MLNHPKAMRTPTSKVLRYFNGLDKIKRLPDITPHLPEVVKVG